MDIFALLEIARKKQASDVYLVVSSPSLLRVAGSLEQLNGNNVVYQSYINNMLLY